MADIYIYIVRERDRHELRYIDRPISDFVAGDGSLSLCRFNRNRNSADAFQFSSRSNYIVYESVGRVIGYRYRYGYSYKATDTEMHRYSDTSWRSGVSLNVFRFSFFEFRFVEFRFWITALAFVSIVFRNCEMQHARDPIGQWRSVKWQRA